jgi:oxygen-independent coproporphyrinogen III oxidase
LSRWNGPGSILNPDRAVAYNPPEIPTPTASVLKSSDTEMTRSPPQSAYIHVPFCQHRCGYCDFAIVAGRDDLVEPFLDALAIELSWLGDSRPVETLYFGGGTPNRLDDAQLDRLCDLVLRQHPLANGAEWTVEANPDFVTASQIELLASRGVTRLSLGVQSFDDAKLQRLDRRHTRREATRAVGLAQKSNLAVSIDLIFSAPGETLDLWRQDLADAVALTPEHISTYGLTFERGTPFTLTRDRGGLAELDEELQRTLYAEAIDSLAAAGYEHYETSNFARPGKRSRHNEVYWAGREYYAAGPGAARYVGGVREINHRSTTNWMKRVAAGESPIAEREELSPERKARERLVLGLRRMEGITRPEFAAASGYSLDDLAGEAIARFVDLKLLEDDGRRVRLTREGLMISDALWPEIL